MSVNLKYQHVTHLAHLSVLRVLKVVGTTPPPAAEDLPSFIAAQPPFLRQYCQPYQFVGTAAFVKKQLCFLKVHRRFYFFIYSLIHQLKVWSKVLSNILPTRPSCSTLCIRWA